MSDTVQWQESTALMLASEEGHLDVVMELLEANADINTQDEVRKLQLLMGGSWEVLTSIVTRLLVPTHNYLC